MTVKEILVQRDSDGKRGKWIAKIQEYDMDIKPLNSSKDMDWPKSYQSLIFKPWGLTF